MKIQQAAQIIGSLGGRPIMYRKGSFSYGGGYLPITFDSMSIRFDSVSITFDHQ